MLSCCLPERTISTNFHPNFKLWRHQSTIIFAGTRTIPELPAVRLTIRFVLLYLILLSLPVSASDVEIAQATLAETEASLHRLEPPTWLPAPFNDTEARAWVRHAADTKRSAQTAISRLDAISARVDLPLTRGTVQQGADYDKQDLGRLRQLANRIVRRVDEAVEQTNTNLGGMMQVQGSELEYFRNLDPENPSHRTNAYLGDGAQPRIYGQLDLHAARAESWAAWQRAFGREPTDNTRARIAEISNLRQRYAEQRAALIGQSRLPEPASSDAQRLEIARQILARPEYEFGEHGSIVLTSPDVTTHEREVSRAEIRELDISLSGEMTLTGTQTTWQYRWEEFRFATPIQDRASGDWHIWWITARKYSSGWDKTPIGKWVSGAAVKGDLIAERNI